MYLTSKFIDESWLGQGPQTSLSHWERGATQGLSKYKAETRIEVSGFSFWASQGSPKALDPSPLAEEEKALRVLGTPRPQGSAPGKGSVLASHRAPDLI